MKSIKFTDYSPPKTGAYVSVDGRTIPSDQQSLVDLAMNAMLLSGGKLSDGDASGTQEPAPVDEAHVLC